MFFGHPVMGRKQKNGFPRNKPKTDFKAIPIKGLRGSNPHRSTFSFGFCFEPWPNPKFGRGILKRFKPFTVIPGIYHGKKEIF